MFCLINFGGGGPNVVMTVKGSQILMVGDGAPHGGGNDVQKVWLGRHDYQGVVYRKLMQVKW